MDQNGWVKIHRKMLANPAVNKDHDHLAVWVYLLCHATHKPRRANFSGHMVDLKPGQLITGRLELARETHLNDSKVERILKLFKNEQQIEQQTSNRSRLITIIKWEQYQQNEQQTEQQMNNKRTTDEQQVNTIQEYKELKEGKELKKGECVAGSIEFSNFESYCRKWNVDVATTEKKYLLLKAEYDQKVPWWQETQKCITWLVDRGQKKVTLPRLKNWMNKAVSFQKDRAIRLQQEYRDKKDQKLRQIKPYKMPPLWTLPE